MIIHYDPDTMQVMQISGGQPFEREGLAIAFADEVPDFTGKRLFVESVTDLGECTLVVRNAAAPSAQEILLARNAELTATDSYMVADRPLSDVVREQWRAYRQALRDLGVVASADEMIAAWPLRPTGHDAILELR